MVRYNEVTREIRQAKRSELNRRARMRADQMVRALVRAREWAAANPERVAATRDRYRMAHPERVAQSQQDYYRRNVGKARDQILAEQPRWLRSRTRVLASTGGTRSHPLNDGIAAARGSLISFLDDDDLVFGHWVETFLNAAEHHPRQVLRAAAGVQWATTIAWPGGIEGHRTESALSSPYPARFDLVDIPALTAIYRRWNSGQDSYSRHDESVWRRDTEQVRRKLDAETVDRALAALSFRAKTNQCTPRAPKANGRRTHQPRITNHRFYVFFLLRGCRLRWC